MLGFSDLAGDGTMKTIKATTLGELARAIDKLRAGGADVDVMRWHGENDLCIYTGDPSAQQDQICFGPDD